MRAYGEYVQILPEKEEKKGVIITEPKRITTGRAISIGEDVSVDDKTGEQVVKEGNYCQYSLSGAEYIAGVDPANNNELRTEEKEAVSFLFVKEDNILFTYNK